MSCCTRNKRVSKKAGIWYLSLPVQLYRKKKHLQQNPAVVPYVFFLLAQFRNVHRELQDEPPELHFTLAMCMEIPTLVRQRIRLIPKTTVPLGCISLVYLQCNCSASSLKGKVFQSTASPATGNLPQTPTLTETSDTDLLL